jgi:hypothetical protein
MASFIGHRCFLAPCWQAYHVSIDGNGILPRVRSKKLGWFGLESNNTGDEGYI